MPLTRVTMLRGRPVEYRQAAVQSIYQAMRETFAVPQDDLFAMIHEVERENFVFGANYMDIARSDDLLIIQIICTNSRSVEQKKALYARTAELLAEKPGVRTEDVFINLVETAKENWSFGLGTAQYA
ncbi:MAG: tautomerase family protein [Neomegalonema sp.]|nr:tautomerase family protein [Neomegalonema sp.]